MPITDESQISMLEKMRKDLKVSKKELDRIMLAGSIGDFAARFIGGFLSSFIALVMVAFSVIVAVPFWIYSRIYSVVGGFSSGVSYFVSLLAMRIYPYIPPTIRLGLGGGKSEAPIRQHPTEPLKRRIVSKSQGIYPGKTEISAKE